MQQIVRSNGVKYTLKDNTGRYFNPKEYLKTYEYLKPRQKHVATCLINTGARFNEFKHVKVEDIKFPDKNILDDRGSIVLKVTKTKSAKGERRGRHRHFVISTEFSKYLKKYIRENNLKYDDTLKFIENSSFNIGLKKAAAKAGLKNPRDFSAHSLRKTMETYLMALDVNDMKILRHLGHDMKTAVSHYVSPDVFNGEDRILMRKIIGDLYLK